MVFCRYQDERRVASEKRLQLTGLFRKFIATMNSRAANGFRHLRRPRIENPGWVAV
jgi:hypothetical protein